MMEITVTYVIDEDEEQRLNKIVDSYKKQGLDSTPEKIFDFIMTVGSNYDKDKKFEYHEKILGIC